MSSQEPEKKNILQSDSYCSIPNLKVVFYVLLQTWNWEISCGSLRKKKQRTVPKSVMQVQSYCFT